MSLIQLKNVNVSFEKKGSFFTDEKNIHVLKDVNLEIEEGEIVALVGESGCGKTTTGRVITGLQTINSGEVLFQGKILYTSKRDRRSKTKIDTAIQFIQQDSYAALNPVKTIRQSLEDAIYCANKKIKKQELNEKINELMSLIGLVPAEQFLSKYPHNLSGGQRQRLLMTRAIAFEPKIIVADEPVSMIDVSMRISILNLMNELNKKLKISFVYITHDLSTARYIAKNGKICVMYLGEIVEMGNVNEILDNPKHPYTKALIKAVPDMYNNEYGELPLKSMHLIELDNRKEGCSFRNRCIYELDECSKCVRCTNINGVQVRCNLYKDE